MLKAIDAPRNYHSSLSDLIHCKASKSVTKSDTRTVNLILSEPMIRNIALTSMAIILLPACSTIDRGLTDHIRVDTVPQGAKVSVLHIPFKDNPKQVGAIERVTCAETPCAIEVRRLQRGIVSIEKDGYEKADYYIGPSRYRAGGAVDLGATALKTTSTSLGTGMTLGLTYASFSQVFAGLGNVLTLGLGNYQGVSTATGATAGTGVGIGIAVGSMLFDAGSGANQNIYPNPVIIGMAPNGTTSEGDPFVDAYYTLIRAYTQKEKSCSQRTKRDEIISCSDANRSYRDARSALMDLEDERDDAIKALVQAQKEAQAKQETAQ